MLTVLCRNGAKLVRAEQVWRRWSFIQKVFDCGFACQEVTTRTFDLSEYLDIRTAMLIYTCLEGDQLSLQEMMLWCTKQDFLDINNHYQYLCLRDDKIFVPFWKLFTMVGENVGVALDRIIYFVDYQATHPCPVTENPYLPDEKFVIRHKRSRTLDWSRSNLFCKIVENKLPGTQNVLATHVLHPPTECRANFLPNSAAACELILAQQSLVGNKWVSLSDHLLLDGSHIALQLYMALRRNERLDSFASLFGGFNALHIASVEGNMDIVAALCTDEALCIQPDELAGALPLHVAAWADQSKVFFALLPQTCAATGLLASSLCNTQCKKHGWTVVHYALAGAVALDTKCEILRWLLEHKCASLEIVDSKGRTILDLAMQYQHTLTLRLISEMIESAESKDETEHPQDTESNPEWCYEDDDASMASDVEEDQDSEQSE